MQLKMKDSGQAAEQPKQFKLGHLGTLNQVIVALGKTIRGMADGSVDSQVGSRICNGLGHHEAVPGDQDPRPAR